MTGTGATELGWLARLRERADRSGTLRRFRKHRAAQAGGALVLAFLVMAALAPFLAPFGPEEIDLQANLQRPSWRHPLGTDSLGRDILARIVYGARVSMTIGVVSVGLALLVGVPIGAFSGYKGAWADRTIMRTVDVILSFPTILLAIIVITVLGPGLFKAMIAIGIAEVPVYARLMRGAVLTVKGREFVEAARTSGGSERRVLWRHILPNCLPPLIVQSALLFASAILSAAYLGFLGLGAQPPTPEWGSMLSKGRDFLRVAPHVSIFPGVTIMVTVLGFNLFSDGLRDALDPRMKV